MIPEDNAETAEDKTLADETKISSEKAFKSPINKISLINTTSETSMKRPLGDFRLKKLHPR